ncbi:MMPL family transporter [Marinicrinis sediminis]|uniref:MMPL family transporter n=1 Tax=Marinicrinis sediminis TaxID=1652465 RepID=A0ABW5RA64_9BACL
MDQQVSEKKGLAKLVGGTYSRWITLGIWISLVVILNAVFPQGNSQTNENAQNLADSLPSVQAEQIAKQEFPSESGVPALIVLHREKGMTDGDVQIVQQLTAAFTQEPLPNQSLIVPLHELPLPAVKGQLSEDGSTFVLPIFFNKEADVDQLKESMDQFQERVDQITNADLFAADVDSSEELSARITGPVGIQIDATGLFSDADVSLLIATVILVLVFLLLIYRSPILALIPLVAVGFAYGVISPLLGWMAREEWIVVDSQGLSIMTVLLFGAGTDYCLFLIARFRQLLMVESSKTKALFQAVTGSTGAIAMSGFTVVISLLALLLADYGGLNRFAIPFSLSILIMMIASITLVPAMLAIIGRTSFFPFVPRTLEMRRERAQRKGKPEPKPQKPNRFGVMIGNWITQKPWTVILATIVLLGSFAAFSPQVKYTFDTLSSFPEDVPSREGFQLIGEHFSQGELAPAKVIVDTEGKDLPLQEKLGELEKVAKVLEPKSGQNNPDIVSAEVEFTLNPYGNEAMDFIPLLMEETRKILQDAGIADADSKVWIAGQTAEQYDTRETTDADAKRIIPVVIIMIALLLLLYLRSFIAMLYLMGTVLLSYFSALGLGWIVIHYFMGADAIQGFIPLYAFVFLVALGEDYNIFMVSSIWKKRKQMPLKQAIREGVAETGSVITSAGLILAGTFAVLATLPIQVLVHFGLITAIGVLLDTFIVRPFLVPAITSVLGSLAFWPGKHREVETATEQGATTHL